MSLLALLGAAGSSAAKTYIEDIFAVTTYTGNGGSQTINNGIDLASNGGMTWIKNRALRDHSLTHSPTNELCTNTTNGYSGTTNALTAFTSSGFTVGGASTVNFSAENYVSWTFKKQAKFFDVVSYTGNGTTQAINHGLGQAPGMVVVKRLDSATDWFVWHRSLTSGSVLFLDTTSAQNAWGATGFGNNSVVVDPSATQLTVGNASALNASGGTYVAYLFAHDTSADGLIQCGSFTTDASGNATVNLGWEPQFVMFKDSANATSWYMLDSMRGIPVGGNDASLSPNSSAAEASSTMLDVSATGFSIANRNASASHIYLAIRRGPMKKPTSGNQVYNGALGSASVGIDTNFPADVGIIAARTSTDKTYWFSRLAGSAYTNSSSTAAETANAAYSFYQTGARTYMFRDSLGSDYMGWALRRYPGVFDQVCYTGAGGSLAVTHGLGVTPEMLIIKERNTTNRWVVYHSYLGVNNSLTLNTTDAAATWTGDNRITAVGASTFTLGNYTDVNNSAAGSTYAAYLFATLPGISKVFSFTGNGTSQTINCGFAAGARFILLKRTDSTGDWFVWDSVRGIVAANDPHLSLNTTAAEVTTDDSVDPDPIGFIVNQNTTTNINVSGATYIGLALS